MGAVMGLVLITVQQSVTLIADFQEKKKSKNLMLWTYTHIFISIKYLNKRGCQEKEINLRDAVTIARTPTRTTRHATLLMHSCIVTVSDVPDVSLRKMKGGSGRWRDDWPPQTKPPFYTTKRGTGTRWPDESSLRVFHSECVCVWRGGSKDTLWWHVTGPFPILQFHHDIGRAD